MLDNIPTPSINKMIWWHQKFMGKVYLKEDGNLNPLLIMETGEEGGGRAGSSVFDVTI